MTEPLRPRTVRLMPEWCTGLPLWSDDPDLYGPLEADELGLSRALADDLAAWNRTWEDHASRYLDGTVPPPEAEARWRAEVPRLVERLQDELGPGVQVYLHQPARTTWRDIPRGIGAVVAALRRWWWVRTGGRTAGDDRGRSDLG